MVLASIVLVLLAVALVALALRVYLGREAESRLASGEIVDFAARDSLGRANVFAMCPPGYCTPPGGMASPVFAVDWQILRARWDEVIAAQSAVARVAWDEDRRRATYIQRSAFFRFPDIVTVEFVALGPAKSSLAIDSRSRYGKGDLGVNRRRVLAWMEALQTLLIGDAQ